jgi:hypothetical protein
MICLHVSLLRDDPNSLREFELQEFQMFFLEITQRKITEVNDMPPHVLVDGWSRFTSGLWVFGSSVLHLFGTSALYLFGSSGLWIFSS